MTSTLKLYGGIAILVILCLLGWHITRWDSKRLEAQFHAGELAERQKWNAAQALATASTAAKARGDTVGSEAIADHARQEADNTAIASTTRTQETIEKIIYAYESAPPVACRPDTRPVYFPVGVLEGLDQARSAALGGSAAPAPR